MGWQIGRITVTEPIRPDDGPIKRVYGPHLPLMGTITVTLIVSIGICFCVSALPSAPIWLQSLFVGGFCATLWTYYNTATSNPGIVTRPDADVDVQAKEEGRTKEVQRNRNANGEIWCAACQFFVPEHCAHCEYCEVCIEEHDHHCPWIGQCVGKGNISWFYSFLASLGGTLLTMMLTAFMSVIQHASPASLRGTLADGQPPH